MVPGFITCHRRKEANGTAHRIRPGRAQMDLLDEVPGDRDIRVHLMDRVVSTSINDELTVGL